jgi:predicted MFS family arabinose efflux permease
MTEISAELLVARTIRLLSFAAFASVAAIRICDPMLPEIADSFAISHGQASAAITSYAVAYGLLQLLYGPLGDRYSKYHMIMMATFACIIGSISAAISPSFSWLVFSRALAGAIAAGIVPLSIAWIGDNVPYEQRQATLARFLSGPILGLIGGQFLGGFVADMFGWRWCFIVLAGMYLIVGMLLYRDFRYHKLEPSHESVAISGIPSRRLSFLWQFVEVLRISWVRVILVTVFLEAVAVFGSLAFVPTYLHISYGISLTAAGSIIAIFGFGGLSYTIFARRLIHLVGERGLALIGGPLLGAAFLLFLVGNGWQLAIPASFMTGLGFYMLHNTLQTNATQMAPESRGTAVAMFVSAFFLGQSAGVSIGSYVIDVAGMSWLFASSAVMLPFIGIGFAFLLRYRKADYSSEFDTNTGA